MQYRTFNLQPATHNETDVRREFIRRWTLKVEDSMFPRA